VAFLAAFWAAFLAAFFCRLGNLALFFSASFGTLGFGAVTPTTDAIVPAADPMVFAAETKTPSDTSCSTFFFAMWKPG